MGDMTNLSLEFAYALRCCPGRGRPKKAVHSRRLEDLRSKRPLKRLRIRILHTNGMNKEQDNSHTRQKAEIGFEVFKNWRKI
jgi:hypothetical protein